jgi:hypothetical protein
MKRLFLSLLVVIALVSSWRAASADDHGRVPRAHEDLPPAAELTPPEGSRFEDENWVALSVSADGRMLVVQGLGGGCGHDPRASATETASTVEIRVRQLVPADLSGVRCPAIARIDILRVRLSAPIAGRALIGQSLRAAVAGPARRATVPNVIGLRAADARFALRAQGFRVRDDGDGVVHGQRPSPHTPAQAERVTVTLLAR